MWTVVFFIYTLIYLVISSMVSIKLRNVPMTNAVNYLNDIMLLITVALLSSTITLTFTLSDICLTTRPVNYVFYAVLVLIVLNVALNIISIMMVSNSQFKNCPQDVRSLIIASLTFNLAGTVGGITYGIIQSEEYIKAIKGVAANH
jgi:hypothetical protein